MTASATPSSATGCCTTILEPDQAPARELGVLYHERWEIENALDELKIHQRGPRVVLRSKQPDGVYQEAYGYLCTHYAIRRLMHDAALTGDLDPDRLSFTRSLRAARRISPHPAGIFPPRRSTAPMSTRSPRSSPSDSAHAGYAPTRASSSAR